MSVSIYPELQTFIESRVSDFSSISEDRKLKLEEIAKYIGEKQRSGEPIFLTFICTHNSRRSHLGQIWAQTAAEWYGLEGIRTFSGGTEATAFNPRAVAALERAGFRIDKGEGDNPKYEVKSGNRNDPMVCFSKKYQSEFNPSDSFAAIMVCTDADRGCPLVSGAEFRIAIPYIDPKVADGKENEAATYDERSRQIATEMLYLMSVV